MINTRGAAELAQNTWMKDYRALSEMGRCLSLSERLALPLSSLCFAHCCCCLLGQETWAQHLGLSPQTCTEWPRQRAPRGSFQRGPLVQHAKAFTAAARKVRKYTSWRTKSLEKESATTLGRKSQFYFTIRKRYRWATPWVSRGSTSTRRTHHQTRLWSSD